ncbi:hypothetical protein PF011_g3959 [Phytophthora fragariae]|uniref:Uncharacterized protein n=1 Tax=Phytophthora fragariae TaxID=53985 RepID=A0A6A3LZF4_9STRA|nr:hypothetical protein PF011_g3959 [Phytophthora fragariae]
MPAPSTSSSTQPIQHEVPPYSSASPPPTLRAASAATLDGKVSPAEDASIQGSSHRNGTSCASSGGAGPKKKQRKSASSIPGSVAAHRGLGFSNEEVASFLDLLATHESVCRDEWGHAAGLHLANYPEAGPDWVKHGQHNVGPALSSLDGGRTSTNGHIANDEGCGEGARNISNVGDEGDERTTVLSTPHTLVRVGKTKRAELDGLLELMRDLMQHDDQHRVEELRRLEKLRVDRAEEREKAEQQRREDRQRHEAFMETVLSLLSNNQRN